MKKLKKTLMHLVLFLLLCGGLAVVTGNGYLLRGISRTYLAGNSTANINDHQVFETRQISKNVEQPWPLHANYTNALPSELSQYMAVNEGVAFIVVHQGRLLAEHYAPGYSNNSRTNSFSMAKTVVTMLVGIAIEEGILQGLDQPVTDLLPEFSDDPNGQVATIGSLSSMTSGYEWDERYYSPLSPTVELYYASDVAEFVLEGYFSKPAESFFYYSSASTQLLALTLTRALQARNSTATLSDYLSEKLWQPLGMNADGLWHLDNNGMELAYCCVNTNARNFAKLGQLVMQGGRWRDQQLVPQSFLELMTTPKADPFYGYSVWINDSNSPPFYAFRGHLGQFIIVVPELELVVVRLGESLSGDRGTMQSLLPFYIEQARKLIPASDHIIVRSGVVLGG